MPRGTTRWQKPTGSEVTRSKERPAGVGRNSEVVKARPWDRRTSAHKCELVALHDHNTVMTARGIPAFLGRGSAMTHKVLQAARKKGERRTAMTAAVPATRKAHLSSRRMAHRGGGGERGGAVQR
jgi:hypothetical protein